jgi:ferredoxin
MKAKVDENKCIGCGVCKDSCPVNAINIEDSKAVVNDNCIGCGACVSECPVDAIEI